MIGDGGIEQCSYGGKTLMGEGVSRGNLSIEAQNESYAEGVLIVRGE